MLEKLLPLLWLPPRNSDSIEQQAFHLWANTDLLNGLHRRSLHTLISQCDIRRYTPGEALFHAGDIGVAVGLVVQGELRIESGTKAIATLEKGMIFGETALLSDAPRTASVTSLTESHVALLTRFQVDEFITHRPVDGARLMSNLARLLAARLQQVYAASSHD